MKVSLNQSATDTLLKTKDLSGKTLSALLCEAMELLYNKYKNEVQCDKTD